MIRLLHLSIFAIIFGAVFLFFINEVRTDAQEDSTFFVRLGLRSFA